MAAPAASAAAPVRASSNLDRPRRSVPGVGPFVAAGVASVGAGAVHLAAIGPHADDPQAAGTFAALGLAQLAWGAAALTARSRRVAVAGLALQAVAVAGWVSAKTVGIGWIEGLGSPEALQWADVGAAMLALASLASLGRAVLSGSAAPAPSRRSLAWWCLAVLGITVLGVATSGGHRHDHAHDPGPIGHAHPAGVVPPTAYDPTAVDLSGVPGVTPAQQARGERLVRDAVVASPRFADRDAAVAAGFTPRGAPVAGLEQLVRWASLTDDHVADPAHPEGLLYEVDRAGQRTLVALALLLEPGTPVADAPDVAGSLAAWRTEDHLCRAGGGPGEYSVTLAGADGGCPAGQRPLEPMAILPVWVVANPCGPFASVEASAAWLAAESEGDADAAGRCDAEAHGP